MPTKPSTTTSKIACIPKEIAVNIDGDKHLNIKVQEVSKENINMIANKRAF
jgi:hypothetical protein